MKKIIALTATVIFLTCMSITQAQAGAARKHTIEGIMLGAGAAILGAAIINGMNDDPKPQYARHVPPPQPPQYRSEYRPRHKKFRNHHRIGHWEIQRIWVPPVFETRWNPGHYTPGGKWVDGRNQQFTVSEGYYREEKVWVSRHR